MKKKFCKNGFTLAEVMVVLTVIGVLAMILLPIAFHAAPDEEVMKYKKAHNTLGNVIRELVNLDTYYADGDLGKKPDGSYVEDSKYFCESFADMVNAKEYKCDSNKNMDDEYCAGSTIYVDSTLEGFLHYGLREEHILNKDFEYKKYNYIETNDGIVYIDACPKDTYGAHNSSNKFYHPDPSDVKGTAFFSEYYDENGISKKYKGFCVGLKDKKNKDKINDAVCYGIRRDGKIYPSSDVNAMLEKSIQKE